MKTLVLYYSYTGNTKKAAKELASKLGCDIEEVETLKKYGTFQAFLLGCPMAIMRKGAPIKLIKSPVNDYDKFILLTPIWAGNPAPAFNSALDVIPRGKEVEIYAVSASGKSAEEKTVHFAESKGLKVDGYHNIK